MVNFKKRPELKGILDEENIPAHVGVIMDGNGRWAKNRHLPRTMGHRAGVDRLRSVIRFASEVGIETLTVYAFSTENWNRPNEEVSFLMELLIEFMNKEIQELYDENVKITFIGNIAKLPTAVFEALQKAKEKTSQNTGLILNIALNYGGRDEIIRATKAIATMVQNGEIKAEEVDAKIFESQLDTNFLQDPDLIIRTSGEQRMSNFLTYQASYAELVFCPAYWPDFDDGQFTQSLKEYQERVRRFGGL